MPPLRVNRRPSPKILFHIFLLAGSQENIKKFRLRLLFPLRLRHLILLFGRKNKNMFQKIKNKIKLFRHQCKMSLKQCYFVYMGPLYRGKTCYFFGFCVVEEVYLVVTCGCMFFMHFLFMLLICYYFVMIN